LRPELPLDLFLLNNDPAGFARRAERHRRHP
jgi:hypothetical protein